MDKLKACCENMYRDSSGLDRPILFKVISYIDNLTPEWVTKLVLYVAIPDVPEVVDMGLYIQLKFCPYCGAEVTFEGADHDNAKQEIRLGT